MMKRLFSLSTLVFSTAIAFGQHGKIMEGLKYVGQKPAYTIEYSIYLPPDYETSQRSYPVLYLLHGFSDNETGWVQFGEAGQIADKCIENGDAAPCIIVMPNGKVTWYCNSYDGSDPWEDMFIKNFIPYVEKLYRIRPEKQYRAISGLSMGGYGALMLSMRYPDMFSSCVAFSSGTIPDAGIISMPDDQYKELFGNIYGNNLVKEARISDAWISHSPLHLISSVDIEKLKTIKFYIDCGDDDFLYQGNSDLHVRMRDLGIPHEYRVRNGGHQWEYWRTGLPEGLKFISQTFHR
jgi:S-formylglutathione hydrolase FrmB